MIEKEKVENKKAGIDLLVSLYRNYGITAKTLLYCFDEDRARELVREINLEGENLFFTITKKKQKLRDFVADKKFFVPREKNS